MALIDNRPPLWFLILAGLLLLAPAGSLWLRPSCVPLLPPDAHWQITGFFAQGAVYPTTALPAFQASDQTVLWGSWVGSDAHTGQLASPAFAAPALLQLYVAGYPNQPGNGVFLERLDASTRLRLQMPDSAGPGEQWRRQVWRLPSSWKNRPIRLVATDGATSLNGWIGVSAPSSINASAFYRAQLPELRILPLYTLDFFLFLLPGLALVLGLYARWSLSPLHTLILALTASALSGYLAFWLYFFNRSAGRAFSFLLQAVSLVGFCLLILRKPSARRVLRSIAAPLLCSLTAGIFYLSVLYLFDAPSTSTAELATFRFFSERRPPDNEIPLFFAVRLYDRKPLKPFLGDWLSSDRPPLQAGIYLLERPLEHARDSSLHYQLLATALQSLWICGVWAFLYALGASRRRILQTILLLIFSGFLFFNTVYVWPKLLAASFLFLCFALIIAKLRAFAPFSAPEGVLGAACFSLALLAHPGSLFSIPALVVLVLHPRARSLFSWRGFVAGAITTLAFLLPWSAYQKYFDPPGNRLLKWHLGGQVAVDSRSTWQTISEDYRRLTPKTILEYKWANVRNIVGPNPASAFGLPPEPAEAIRIPARRYIWSALGLLNLGWIFAAFACFRRRPPRRPATLYSGLLIAAALLNLAVWSLAIFGPGTTLTEHVSYTDLLLLYIGLTGFLLPLPRPIIAALSILQAAAFALFWVYTPAGNPLPQVPAITPLPQFPLGAVAVTLFLAGLLLLIRYARESQGTQLDSTPANIL